MKRIVDGKMYDTDKAEEICSASYGNPGDFKYWSEALFRTKRGAFFISGEGGAMTKWGKKISQNTWSGGEGIKALTPDEVILWCEDHGIDGEVITPFFAVEDA